MEKIKADNSFRKEQIINEIILFSKTKKKDKTFWRIERKIICPKIICVLKTLLIINRELDSKDGRNLGGHLAYFLDSLVF